jgi:hypothetical protein
MRRWQIALAFGTAGVALVVIAAAYSRRTQRCEFISARFGCHIYQPAIGAVDLAAACIK